MRLHWYPPWRLWCLVVIATTESSCPFLQGQDSLGSEVWLGTPGSLYSCDEEIGRAVLATMRWKFRCVLFRRARTILALSTIRAQHLNKNKCGHALRRDKETSRFFRGVYVASIQIDKQRNTAALQFRHHYHHPCFCKVQCCIPTTSLPSVLAART